MALNGSDNKLIDDLAKKLRVRFEECIQMDAWDPEEFGNTASIPVVITKDELRNNSKRRNARDAYLIEFATKLNQKIGITAHADLDHGLVYAKAVPDAEPVYRPLTMSQLNSQAERAAKSLAEAKSAEEMYDLDN